eukprot:RCo004372
MGLGVEPDDVLHGLRVVVPVQGLQKVRGQDVDFLLPGMHRKEDNLLLVPGLQQHLHSLQLFSSLGVFLAGQMPRFLGLSHLGNLLQQGQSVCLTVLILRLWQRHCLRHLFRQLHVILHAQLQSPLKGLRGDEHLCSLIKLLVFDEELGAAYECLWVSVSAKVIRNGGEHVKKLSLDAQLQSSGNIPALLVEQHRPVHHSLVLEVLCGVQHHGGAAGLQREVDGLSVHVLLFGDGDAVAVALGDGEVVQRLFHPVILLVVPCQVVRCSGVAGGCHELLRSVHGAQVAMQPHLSQDLLGLGVECQSPIVIALTLQVLSPPDQQLTVPASCDIALQVAQGAVIVQHPGHLVAVGTGGFVLLHRGLHLPSLLKIPCVAVVHAAKVDAVVLLRDLQGELPFPAALVELVQQVISLALPQQPLSLVQQPQVSGQHRRPGVHLRVHLGLPQGSRRLGILDVRQAHLGHVHPLRLHAHHGHVVPHGLVADALHGAVGVVHVAQGKVVAEVQQGLLHPSVRNGDAVEVGHRLDLDVGLLAGLSIAAARGRPGKPVVEV